MIKKRSKTLLILGLIASIAILAYSSAYLDKTSKLDITLKNNPKLFEKDVIIVIGENSTQIEYEGAEAIAESLYNITGNIPVIKSDTELTEDDKTKYNLILVGSPNANSVVHEEVSL